MDFLISSEFLGSTTKTERIIADTTAKTAAAPKVTLGSKRFVT